MEAFLLKGLPSNLQEPQYFREPTSYRYECGLANRSRTGTGNAPPWPKPSARTIPHNKCTGIARAEIDTIYDDAEFGQNIFQDFSKIRKTRFSVEWIGGMTSNLWANKQCVSNHFFRNSKLRCLWLAPEGTWDLIKLLADRGSKHFGRNHLVGAKVIKQQLLTINTIEASTECTALRYCCLLLLLLYLLSYSCCRCSLYIHTVVAFGT